MLYQRIRDIREDNDKTQTEKEKNSVELRVLRGEKSICKE